MLSKQALQEFKQIWKKKYGEEISEEFALEQAISLLAGFDKIYRPIKKDWVVSQFDDDKSKQTII